MDIKVTMEKAEAIIKELKERPTTQFFHVVFKKKNGDIRRMQASFNVKKYLKGGVLKYNPEDHGLVCVSERDVGYKMINLKNLISVSTDKNKYIVGGV